MARGGGKFGESSAHGDCPSLSSFKSAKTVVLRTCSVSAMKEVLIYICPFCEREVRVGAPCGGCTRKQKPVPAEVKRSWEQDQVYDGLDLPDEDFDYDEFVAREFGHVPHKKLGVKWYWWWVGVVLLVVMAMFSFYLF